VRPVFYSEADFQHALAWDIHLAEPGARLRLEAPLLAGGKERLDVYAQTESGRYAIELKYPRAGFQGGDRRRTGPVQTRKSGRRRTKLAGRLRRTSAGLSG
jgi:hypothetical protein